MVFSFASSKSCSMVWDYIDELWSVFTGEPVIHFSHSSVELFDKGCWIADFDWFLMLNKLSEQKGEWGVNKSVF